MFMSDDGSSNWKKVEAPKMDATPPPAGTNDNNDNTEPPQKSPLHGLTDTAPQSPGAERDGAALLKIPTRTESADNLSDMSDGGSEKSDTASDFGSSRSDLSGSVRGSRRHHSRHHNQKGTSTLTYFFFLIAAFWILYLIFVFFFDRCLHFDIIRGADGAYTKDGADTFSNG